MNWTVLGSGTIIPDPARNAAGFLVRSGGVSLLVDGGPGTLRRLTELGVDPRRLDGGVYSHRHPDHCAELLGLLFTFKANMDGQGRCSDYPIWAGEGFGDYLTALKALHPGWLESERWATPVQEMRLSDADSAQLPGGLRLSTRPARHSASALHLRFDGPRGESVVFSGDSGPSEGLVQLATGVDLLVVECAIVGDHPGHLTPEQVRDLVVRARPGRVLLTHLYPEVEPERALAVVGEAGAPVELAWDGQSISL